MAGLRDLIQSYAYGGPVRRYDGATGSVVNSTPQPAFSSDPTINAAWLSYAGQNGNVNATGLTDAQKAAAQTVFDARTKIAQQNAAYNDNKNVQGLYGLNQNNADTFLKDASAGLVPLTTGQNPNTQTYTSDAGKTMAAFEQALMANPTGANALFQSFNGTGSNPLLGQYNVLPSPTGTQGGILPWQNGAPTPGLSGTPAYTPPKPSNATNTSAALTNAGTTSGTTGTTAGTTGTTAGTTGTSTGTPTPTSTGTSSSTSNTLLSGQILPIGTLFNPSKVLMNGVSYTDNDGYAHYPVSGGGEYVVNRAGIIVEYAPARSASTTTYVKPTGSNYVPPAPTPTPTPTTQTYDWTNQDVTNAANPYGQQLPTGTWFDPKTTPITGKTQVLDTGITIVPTKNGSYAVDTKTGKIVNYTNTTKPNQAYFDTLNGVTHAKGGSVGMPQEYSRGNWKLI
jgi:hypothetical protein